MKWSRTVLASKRPKAGKICYLIEKRSTGSSNNSMRSSNKSSGSKNMSTYKLIIFTSKGKRRSLGSLSPLWMRRTRIIILKIWGFHNLKWPSVKWGLKLSSMRAISKTSKKHLNHKKRNTKWKLKRKNFTISKPLTPRGRTSCSK